MWLAVVIIVALCAMLVYAGNRIESLQRSHEHEVDHAKCMAHVAHYVGNEFAAHVLQAAATDFDSMKGKRELEVIRNTGSLNDRVSIPAEWLSQRAAALSAEVRK